MRKGWVFAILGGPHILWLALFFIFPLLSVLGLSFSSRVGIVDHDLTWTWENYTRATEPIYLAIFFRSLVVATAATLICLLIAYPVALAMAFSSSSLKVWLLFIITLPFWINMLVRTYALIAVFRTNGYLNDLLGWFWQLADVLFGLLSMPLGEAPAWQWLYTNAAVVLGVAYVFLPFMILPIYAVLDRFERDYLEASLDLGAGHWHTFLWVLLPLTLPGVAAGVIIVFIPALGAFFIPQILGGADSQLIGNLVEHQFLSGNHWPFGAALSFMLMGLTFLACCMRHFFTRGRVI